MMSPSEQASNVILRLLCFPETIDRLETSDWELLVRCARHCKLLAHLGSKIEQLGLSSSVPGPVLGHFIAAQNLVNYRNRLAMWELNRIRRAVYGLNIDIIVLKGGAYNLLKLPFAKGRLLADIDILVNKDDLQKAETCLIQQGWKAKELSEYDQKYYRTWMHEVPPLRHQERFIEVDLHHTILPLSSRLHPSPELLIENSVVVEGKGYKVLSPVDMILHSSVHLFYDAELNGGDFRDLVDLSELITLFHSQYEFLYEELLERADQLTLQRPLFYALCFVHSIIGVPVPDKYIAANKAKPNYLIRRLMNYLVPLALLPEHPDFPRQKVVFARWLLYVRSHYLRMPLYLLIPHLMKKNRKRLDDIIV